MDICPFSKWMIHQAISQVTRVKGHWQGISSVMVSPLDMQRNLCPENSMYFFSLGRFGKSLISTEKAL